MKPHVKQFIKFSIIVITYMAIMLGIGFVKTADLISNNSEKYLNAVWILTFIVGLSLVLFYVPSISPIPHEQQKDPHERKQETM